jgi:hypothetical protein
MPEDRFPRSAVLMKHQYPQAKRGTCNCIQCLRAEQVMPYLTQVSR